MRTGFNKQDHCVAKRGYREFRYDVFVTLRNIFCHIVPLRVAAPGPNCCLIMIGHMYIQLVVRRSWQQL